MSKELKKIATKSHFYNDTFGVNIHVCFNRDDFNNLIEYFGCKEKSVAYNGATWINGEGRCFIGLFDNKTSTLVHECVHCSLFILEFIKQELKYNDEVLPYLTDYLFRKCEEKRLKNG